MVAQASTTSDIRVRMDPEHLVKIVEYVNLIPFTWLRAAKRSGRTAEQFVGAMRRWNGPRLDMRLDKGLTYDDFITALTDLIWERMKNIDCPTSWDLAVYSFGDWEAPTGTKSHLERCSLCRQEREALRDAAIQGWWR